MGKNLTTRSGVGSSCNELQTDRRGLYFCCFSRLSTRKKRPQRMVWGVRQPIRICLGFHDAVNHGVTVLGFWPTNSYTKEKENKPSKLTISRPWTVDCQNVDLRFDGIYRRLCQELGSKALARKIKGREAARKALSYLAGLPLLIVEGALNNRFMKIT